MIPLRDNIPSQRFPAVTVALIVVNVLAFLHELALGRQVEAFIQHYGIVPAVYTDPDLRNWVLENLGWSGLIKPLFSSMFLHGGWMHIIGNLWVLWIFGDNVEDRMGRLRYLIFYLLSGLMAAAVQILTSWNSSVPTIGASGAIAGVMGAYLVLFPHAKVLTLIPLGIIFDIIPLPAVIFLGFWFLLQLFSGAFGMIAGHVGGIAFWAHIGGFAFGALLVKAFIPRPLPTLSGNWELLR